MKPPDSLLNTVSVPAIGAPNPALIIQAGNTPLRVMVRNIGGVLIFIAHAAQELTEVGANSGVYQLPAGMRDWFDLAPKQTLVGAALGGGGLVSIAASAIYYPEMGR